MRKKIMVVDDSSSFRTIVKLSLTSAGYEVVEAVNGADAFSKLKQVNPALVLCDLNMPEMNGIDLTQKIRKELNFRAPVVMLTTESDSAKKKLGRQAGVSVWMTKPFTPSELLASIKQLCG